MRKTLNYIRRTLLWPIALVNNSIQMLIGIVNPRDFLIFSFSYCPMAFFEPTKHSKFRRWFDTSEFGWYWKSSSYFNNRTIKKSTWLQWLLRFRWIFLIPSETVYCLVETDWMDKDWKMITKAHMYYVWTVLIDGNYDSRERHLYE